MARLLLDLLVLAALARELLALTGVLPPGLFLSAASVFSLGLGMSASSEAGSAIIRDPVGTITRNALAVMALVLYLRIQLLAGTLWQPAMLTLTCFGVYLVGRFIGMTLRGVWFAACVLLAIYVLARL